MPSLFQLCVTIGVSLHATAAIVTVSTPAGDIIGSTHATYERFGYIPYAAAPVGKLRWSAPQPLITFPEGTHDGSRANYRPACPQIKKPLVNQGVSDDQDEDCLFLYIWRPLGTTALAKLPVAVFTHGGAHFQGSGTDMYVKGASLAEKGVLLVTINYRLGLLGFMNDVKDPSGGSSGVTSVAGALDNLEALRFVQRNIASLGGDPEKVTVFGESAGASNCLFLITSKSMVERKENLFQRIFIMSPTHLHFDVMPAEDRIPQLLSSTMNCPDPVQDSVASWKCLRSKPWKDIWEKLPPQGASRVSYLMTLSSPYTGLLELPTLQPKFQENNEEWPTSPTARMKAGKIASGLDIVIGQTRDEGSLFTTLAFMVSSTSNLRFFEDMLRKALDDGQEKETHELIQYYLNLAQKKGVWAAQVQFCGDVMFGVPVHLSLSTIAAKSTTTNLYSYVFSYVPEGGAYFLGQNVGAAHGLELQFYFNALDQSGFYGALDNSKMNSLAGAVSQKLFLDFVKTGKSECLKQYKDNKRSFCEITPEAETQVIENYRKEAMDLWDNWMSTAPNGWPSWGDKGEYRNEPTMSWLLNQVLITELIMLGEDVRRMVVYGFFFLCLIWKCQGKCGCCGCWGRHGEKKKSKNE